MHYFYPLEQKSFTHVDSLVTATALPVLLYRSDNGSIFIKNRHFIIQERFDKLIYGINTIIKCGILQPVKFQLVSLT